MTDPNDLSAGFRTGEWLVLPAEGIVRRGDDARSPEPLQFKLLMVLASRQGELVSKDELIEILWDNRAQSDAPLNRCVSQLRKALDDAKPYRYIENVSKRGYRLKSPVVPLKAADIRPAANEVSVAPEAPVIPAPVLTVPGARRGWLLPAFAVVALGIAAWAYLSRPADPPAAIQTIGVLPFDNLSVSAGSDYLVGGFKEELVSSLHGVPGLSIVNSRLPYDGLETPESHCSSCSRNSRCSSAVTCSARRARSRSAVANLQASAPTTVTCVACTLSISA